MTTLDPNVLVAQVAHELLDPGPMGWDDRREDYLDFCVRNFVDGGSSGVFGTDGTNCAVFVRGCTVQANVMPKGRRPARPAITTWLGVKGFKEDDPETELIEGAWIDIADLEIEPGDILFWTGHRWQKTMALWYPTTNGHVEITLFDGEGFIWPTAGGGGRRHRCAKQEPHDVRESHGRPLRGAWRPRLMVR